MACPSVLTPPYAAPVAAPGWSAQLVVTGLHVPRSLRFDSHGALLVVESGVGLRRLTFDDYGGTCLVVNTSTPVVDAGELNHGLDLAPDGRTLYASSAADVFAWPYDAATGTVDTAAKTTLVTGMYNPDHWTRTLLVSRDAPGTLLVSRGSTADYDPEAANVTVGRGQIRAFNVADPDPDVPLPYDYATGGRVVGYGLRNSVGLAEEPTTNNLYSVENSNNYMTRDGIDWTLGNPGEELNFHGRVSQADSPMGTSYGYPDCVALWDASAVPGSSPGTQVVGNQSSTAMTDRQCADNYTAPRLTFPAHYAPLDLVFRPDGREAYVSFHGSALLANPVGYKIAALSFADGAPVDDAASTTALRDVLTNADLAACPDNCFRPVGLAIDDQGRLWMASDSTGEIYVLQPCIEK